MFCVRQFLLKTNYTNLVRNYNNLTPPKYLLQPIQNREKHSSGSSEKDYLIKTSSDPDVFGSPENEASPDKDDIVEDKYLTSTQPIKKLSTKQYADLIKSYIRKKKIKEAIDVLEVKMLLEDKVKPENYIYNLLLGACGRVGYTKKAFSLYNNMKKRGLVVTGGTYTALFNACANSPWPVDGLTRAKHLQGIMVEKQFEPNETNYNAMIKAFGRCGDLSRAFGLLDEMAAKGHPIRDDSLNFIFQACITDKSAGFRHGLLTWRKMLEKGIKPSLYTFNLILRCVRECGIGDLEVTEDMLRRILPKTDRFFMKQQKLLCEDKLELEDTFYDPISVPSLQIDTSNELSEFSVDNTPDLMSRVPRLGNILSLSQVTKAEERLVLVGGYQGFLKHIIYHNCVPDIKTFTLLLDCLSSNARVEMELLELLKEHNVKPDIDFYNMLIKKRSMRFDYIQAKHVLDLIYADNMRPNIITYGVLALGCKTKEDGLELIEDMTRERYTLNIEILGAMLYQAYHQTNISYAIALMDICIKDNISPNKLFMQHLENLKKKSKFISNSSDNPLSRDKIFRRSYGEFKLRYKSFVRDVKVEEEVHPWQQYRESNSNEGHNYNEKDARFKPRHSSLFRKKTNLEWTKEDKTSYFQRKTRKNAQISIQQ